MYALPAAGMSSGGATPRALARFKEASKTADSWLVLRLGRAYVQAGAFTEADTELDA
jgi:hypothetical protein